MEFESPRSNTYYVMRHGESEANRDRVIVSHSTHGLNGYGLTAKGRAGVEASFRTVGLFRPGFDGAQPGRIEPPSLARSPSKDRQMESPPPVPRPSEGGLIDFTAPGQSPPYGGPVRPDFIYTSDFLRARQTAEIVAGLCPDSRLVISRLLRERNFGDYEGLGDHYYEEVWRLDSDGFKDEVRSIETPDAVAARLRSLLARCEAAHHGAVILLVSHGDPLQILLAIAAGLPPHRHRDVPHLDKSEIRPLLSSHRYTATY